MTLPLKRLRAQFVLPLFTAAAMGLSAPAIAATDDIQFPAFAQAVAEAALGNDEVAAFYRSNGYTPIWTGTAPEDKARRSALFSAIRNADAHGLPVTREDTSALFAMMSEVKSQRDLGRVEVELSRLFLTYAHQIQTGILVPNQIDDGMVRDPHRRDATELLTSFMASDNPDAFFHSLVPGSEEYARLMRKKIELENLIARGGWGPVVPASALEPGDSGPAVVALRNRLIAMGYLDRSVSLGYDFGIQRAVQLFQEDMGLEADGVAGAATMRAINVPVEDRLKSIIVAMERERWLSIDRSQRYIWVNITDFTTRIVDAGKITFETRSVVGQNGSNTRTPEFSDEMELVVINPSWYVPRSIAVNEYLPGMIANGGAGAGHLQLIDGAGRVVSRDSIDWTAVTPGNFPYDLKQPPSQGNALGLVKFLFPNRYNIYLHDTPSKSLFNNQVRAYSHGCIRLQKPFEFAYEILSGQEADPEAFFQAQLRTGRETTVRLEHPIPVHLVYRTAFTDSRGRMSYRSDIYGRDAKIWQALVTAGVSVPGLES